MSEMLASPAFLIGAALLVIVALFFVLLPLIRGQGPDARVKRRRRALEELRDDLEPDEYRARLAKLEQEEASAEPMSGSGRGLAVMLLAAIPVCGLALYLYVGTPEGIDPDTGQTGELRELLGDLTGRVNSEPGDVEAWNQLGMLWKQMQQFPAAESAFRRVIFLEPENVTARVELAETLLYLSGQQQLPPESERLLASVLAQDPQHQKALWLAGLGAFHGGRPQRALELWQRLEQQLPAGPVREQIREQMAMVDTSGRPSGTDGAGGDLPPGHPPIAGAGAASAADEATPEASGGGELPPGHPLLGSDEDSAAPAMQGAGAPAMAQTATAGDADSVTVEVAVAPELRERLTGSETVFVFARAVNGPAAPLAVKRFAASALPTTVVLSESDSMAQGLTITTFPEVRVAARISRTGNVIASPGDLQGLSEPFGVAETARVDVTIDEVVE